MITNRGVFTTEVVIRPIPMIAIVFLIAINITPIHAEESVFQDTMDSFFEGIGSMVKGSVGNDFSQNQTDKINKTVDSGIEAGSIAVEMWRVFHHFVINATLMIASLMGIEIGDTVAYIIGIVVILFVVGGLLRHMVTESWKPVVAILIVLAILLFAGINYLDV